MHEAGASQAKIGAALKICPTSISRRMNALGFAPNGLRGLWAREEDARLRDHFLRGMTITEIALSMGKKPNSVIGRIWRLRLKRDPRISQENMLRGARNRGGMRRSFVPKTVTARSAGEAVARDQLRRRIYNMEPDDMRRVGEPVYRPKFLAL